MAVFRPKFKDPKTCERKTGTVRSFSISKTESPRGLCLAVKWGRSRWPRNKRLQTFHLGHLSLQLAT